MIPFIFILIIVLYGYVFSYIFIKNITLIERASIGFGMGLLIYSFTLFGFLISDIPITSKISLISITPLILLFFIPGVRNTFIVELKKIYNKRLTLYKEFANNHFILFAGLIAIFLLMITAFWPISDWDALTLYDFRGKYLAEGYTLTDLHELDMYDTYNQGYYFSYPPFTSLIHASFYSIGLDKPQLIYPFLLFALTVFIFISLKSFIERKLAYIFSGMLLISTIYLNHASIPYTNLIYIYYYFISSILLLKYLSSTKKSLGALIVSGIFLAGASWARFIEPFYIVNIFLMLWALLSKKLSLVKFTFFIGPIIFLRIMWAQVVKIYSVSSFLSNINYINLINKFFSLDPELVKLSIGAITGLISNHLIIFSILSVITMLYFINPDVKKNQFIKLLLILIYANFALLVFGTLVIGILIPGRTEIYSSLERVGIMLYPFILFTTALLFGALFKKIPIRSQSFLP